jgi:hypothetical protein
MSEACVSEYGMLAKCSRDSCWNVCMWGASDPCEVCIHERCNPKFFANTGLFQGPRPKPIKVEDGAALSAVVTGTTITVPPLALTLLAIALLARLSQTRSRRNTIETDPGVWLFPSFRRRHR